MANWKLSIREKLRYKNIEWLMPSVDVITILEKLGVENITPQGDEEVKAVCPDHKMFVGQDSSDPNWWVNTVTGLTMCFTEGRGSNLVWTVSRLLDVHPREAVKFLMQTDSEVSEATLELAQRKKFRERMSSSMYSEYGIEGKPTMGVRGLSGIERDSNNPYMSDEAYQFFMTPPNKLPTNIQKETVDHYKIFERTYGYYIGRVIVPFPMHKKLVGFCAIDLRGKDKWVLAHPLREIKDYRKVLYPPNFISAGNNQKRTEGCLFGFDDCDKGADILFITEGAREVMKLRQEGYMNAVAILGGYLGEGQFTLITELAPKRIALMFDGDRAGYMIADRVQKRLIRSYPGDRIIKCHVPYGKDPKNLEKADYQKLLE